MTVVDIDLIDGPFFETRMFVNDKSGFRMGIILSIQVFWLTIALKYNLSNIAKRLVLLLILLIKTKNVDNSKNSSNRLKRVLNLIFYFLKRRVKIKK